MPTVMEWVVHLEAKIQRQRTYAAPWERRYRNEHVLPFIEREYREVYGAKVDVLGTSLAPPRTGTAAIGVDAMVARATVLGAQSPREEDAEAVRKVEEAWEDSDLQVMHREAHREAFIKGRSFAMIEQAKDGRAVVGIESADQVAVHRTQHPPYDVDAALKLWTDEWTAQPRGLLMLGDKRYSLTHAFPMMDPQGSQVMSGWRVESEDDAPTGRPAMVEFSHEARLLAEPQSDIERIASLVDIVDLVEGLMVFAGHFGAVPIRWATGLTVPRDPSDPSGQTPLLGPDGKPAIGFNPRADHLWMSTEQGAKFGQLEPAGLASFVSWAEHATKRVRAITSVPGSYYGVGIQSHMSAELLKTEEAPMVRRVNALCRDGSFGLSWRNVNRQILAIELPSLARARVGARWADPETRIEAQSTDSFQKLVASGLGVATVAERVLGWSPELVQRAVAEKAAADAAVLAMSGLGLDDAFTGAGGAEPVAEDPAAVKAKADAMGVLIRSGVDPADAAARVGLVGLDFTGAVPTSLRLPQTEAAELEA